MKNTLHFTFFRALMIVAFGLFSNGAWAQYSGVGTFTKISSIANLTDGYYVIANEDVAAMSSNRSGTATTGYFVADQTAIATGATTITNPSSVLVWKIETVAGAKTIYSEATSKYVGYSSGNAASINDNASANTSKWDITFSNGEFIFKNAGATTRILQYNTSAPRFAAYTGSQQNLTLYKLVATSTTWNGTAWTNGTPSATLDAIIAGNYSTAQGTFTAKSLTVNSGVFTVATGTSMTVENAVVNNATAANFIVESGANLIQNVVGDNTGAITVKRNSSPLFRFDYTLWSSPVVGQNLKAFSAETVSNRFYQYNTATNTNGEYETVFPAQNEATYNFATAKGYLIRTSNTHPLYVQGNSGTTVNAQFVGIPFNQNINLPLSSANTGFNLVGNPYPSAISMSQLFTQNQNAIDGTVWFWRKRNGTVGSGYATSTGLGVTSIQPEVNGINTNGVISAGQGFFVKVKSGATQSTLNFSNTLRSTATNGAFFRSSETTEQVEKHRIWFNISNQNEVIGQTLLGYMTGATEGVDYGIEGKYFNDSPVAFSSFVNNEEFAIQGRSLPFSSADVVPMSFKTDVAGNYTISIDHLDGIFAQDQSVFLKDNLTGQVHDIKASSYNFATEAGIFNSRFEVVYQSLLSIETPQILNSSVVVYKQNGNIVVNAGQYAMSKIEVYDISGRLIATKSNVNASTAVIENLSIANQVLVVKVTTEQNGTTNKKIVY